MLRACTAIALAALLWSAGGLAAERQVTVNDCILTAVANNLRLARQRLATRKAGLLGNVAEQAFWPVLYFEGGYADERVRAAGADALATGSGTWAFDSGVSVRTPVGTELISSLSNARNQVRGDPSLFEPENKARLQLRLNQPLLRGFGVRVNMAELQRADLVWQVARADLRLRLNEVIRDVEAAYWDLYFAQQDLLIKTRSFERADRQFEDTAENIRRGLLPEHDRYVVAESRVSFERKQADALNTLAAARAELAALLQLDPGVGQDMVAIDEPGADSVLPRLERLFVDALSDNPELEAARAQLLLSRVSLVVERDSRLPRLDLMASLALNGLSNSASAGFDDLFSAENHEAFVGLRFEVPLHPLIDDALEVRARLDVRQQLLALQEAEQRVLFRVQNLRRDIEHGRRAYDLSCQVALLARKKLNAQQEKYQAGAAALKDLVQFLRELDQAEIDRLRALVELRKRQVSLQLAVGDLHRTRGIDVH